MDDLKPTSTVCTVKFGADVNQMSSRRLKSFSRNMLEKKFSSLWFNQSVWSLLSLRSGKKWQKFHTFSVKCRTQGSCINDIHLFSWIFDYPCLCFLFHYISTTILLPARKDRVRFELNSTRTKFMNWGRVLCSNIGVKLDCSKKIVLTKARF